MSIVVQVKKKKQYFFQKIIFQKILISLFFFFNARFSFKTLETTTFEQRLLLVFDGPI
jgi:uncharacterized membrane protein YvbJ